MGAVHCDAPFCETSPPSAAGVSFFESMQRSEYEAHARLVADEKTASQAPPERDELRLASSMGNAAVQRAVSSGALVRPRGASGALQRQEVEEEEIPPESSGAEEPAELESEPVAGAESEAPEEEPEDELPEELPE
jgi:hypothetical protein